MPASVSYPFKRTRWQRFREWFVCGLFEHDWRDLEDSARRYIGKENRGDLHIRICKRCLRMETRGVIRP